MNNVLDIRKRLSLSQADLSEALGASQSLISQYEKGGCSPSLKIARKLIDFAKGKGLLLTLDDIYSGPPGTSPGRSTPGTEAAA